MLIYGTVFPVLVFCSGTNDYREELPRCVPLWSLVHKGLYPSNITVLLLCARGAIEWEMIDIIVAKKDVKSSKSIYVLRTSNISEFCECWFCKNEIAKPYTYIYWSNFLFIHKIAKYCNNYGMRWCHVWIGFIASHEANLSLQQLYLLCMLSASDSSLPEYKKWEMIAVIVAKKVLNPQLGVPVCNDCCWTYVYSS